MWHWRACDSVSPQLEGMKALHGAFASRLQFRSRRGLLPVFSAFKVPGCFADILIPGPQNNPAAVNDAATRGACPLSNTSFESKVGRGSWRHGGLVERAQRAATSAAVSQLVQHDRASSALP